MLKCIEIQHETAILFTDILRLYGKFNFLIFVYFVVISIIVITISCRYLTLSIFLCMMQHNVNEKKTSKRLFNKFPFPKKNYIDCRKENMLKEACFKNYLI